MAYVIYDLTREPMGDDYRRLIHVSLIYCDSFLLVMRPSLAISDSCVAVMNCLSPYLLGKSEESEWPGTKLLDDEKATVYKYRLTRESAKILSEITDRLYLWIQPNLPEDLALLRKSGEPWLVSISHEKDGYLRISTDEEQDLLKSDSGLFFKKGVIQRGRSD